MCGHIQESVDRINAIPGLVWVEKRVGIDMLAPISGQSGTADCFILDVAAKTLHCADFKFGLGIKVDAYLSPQLSAYALGALNDIADIFEIEKVVLSVHQPRLENWSQWQTTPAELNAIAQHWRRLLRECLEPNAVFRPEVSSCRFCSNKFTCKARAEQLRRVCTGYFDDLDSIESFDTPMPSEMPDMDSLCTDELIAVHEHTDVVSGFLRDVKTELLRRGLSGEELPGLKLVAGRANRRWRDDVAEREAANFLLAQGVSPSHVIKVERPSPAYAERLLPAKLRKELNTWWIKAVGRPTIVPVEDERPALEPAGLSMFEDLDDADQES
jgi:hypothetical protein